MKKAAAKKSGAGQGRRRRRRRRSPRRPQKRRRRSAAAPRRRCPERGADVMRFATWNVNSLKVRQDRIDQWLADVGPDIVCMQETKIADDAFPQLTFEAMGYTAAHHGEGRWNGVAILSRRGPRRRRRSGSPTAVTTTPSPADDGALRRDHRRHGVRAQRSALDADHYQYKLAWLDRLRRARRRRRPPCDPVIVAGDFNIAPATSTCTTRRRSSVDARREPERARLADAGRAWAGRRVPPPPPRRARRLVVGLPARRLPRGPGDCASTSSSRRSPSSSGRSGALIDRNARKGQLPSDHAPVVVDLAD